MASLALVVGPDESGKVDDLVDAVALVVDFAVVVVCVVVGACTEASNRLAAVFTSCSGLVVDDEDDGDEDDDEDDDDDDDEDDCVLFRAAVVCVGMEVADAGECDLGAIGRHARDRFGFCFRLFCSPLDLLG